MKLSHGLGLGVTISQSESSSDFSNHSGELVDKNHAQLHYLTYNPALHSNEVVRLN